VPAVFGKLNEHFQLSANHLAVKVGKGGRQKDEGRRMKAEEGRRMKAV